MYKDSGASMRGRLNISNAVYLVVAAGGLFKVDPVACQYALVV